ncbi:STAS domain-containing protein [Scytonema sp. PCC 10023]|uniref:STAS domain-containing protein n=1 Tax=Scytonema sp. PCC 10023 TaxID=1680591 RepID=UPI0039C7315A
MRFENNKKSLIKKHLKKKQQLSNMESRLFTAYQSCRNQKVLKSLNMQFVEHTSTFLNKNTDIEASNNHNFKFIVLQPQRRFDMQYGKVLEKELADLIPQTYYFLVIDLGQVDFIDTSGLRALMRGFSATHFRKCRLVMCNLQASIRMIFELTQLDSVFEIFESYEAALTTVNAQL